MIRVATKDDAKGIAEIYSKIVEQTKISFETKAPTISEMEQRVESISSKFPYLVEEIDGNIAGYSYANTHRERSAYRWSCDATIYISEDFRANKIGSKLYSSLFKILTELGYYNVYAGITLPNDPSVGIHERFGFKKIAHYNNVGFKMGAWYDVGWWELSLTNDRKTPSEPLLFPDYIKNQGLNI